MLAKQPKLPVNFTQDFLPERRLICQLLNHAVDGACENKEQISEATGIPTGAKSGKVEPMIHYSIAMGLLDASKSGEDWTLSLTKLGRIILEEDPFLSEPVSLWMMHLMLCRIGSLELPARGIADAWFALFGDGNVRLSDRFSQEAFTTFLNDRHGEKAYIKGLAGQVLRSYLEESCLGLTNALETDKAGSDSYYTRNTAPLSVEYYPAYAAFFFQLWDELYLDQKQVLLNEFFEKTHFLSQLGWDSRSTSDWLDWMVDKGKLQLDRQTGEALALRTIDTDSVLRDIYSELI
ncbi:MAG: DUF4007 family protein [Motiliproteus sp.]|nr:DUF4007 family protein [Motiliproteus sp.]MCW9053512.1 DUF4007 family protein [Motiliproteus sp.]